MTIDARATTPGAAHLGRPPGASALAVLRLQTTKRFETFGSPVVVIAVALVVTALVGLVVWRATPDGSGLWVDVTRDIHLLLPWLVGYMVYNGVQSVAITFPLALTLGATRSAFTLGTIAHHVLVSAHTTLVALLLLACERLTGQWFIGLPLLESPALGGGDPVRLVGILFFTQLAALSVGGTFAAVWVRHGPRVTLAAGVGVVLALLAVVVSPVAAGLTDDFRLWWLAVLATVLIVLCGLVQTLSLRRAAVR